MTNFDNINLLAELRVACADVARLCTPKMAYARQSRGINNSVHAENLPPQWTYSAGGAVNCSHVNCPPDVCSHENCSSSTAHILPRQLLTRSIAHSPTVHSVNCPPTQTSCNDNCSPSITQPQLPTDNCPSTIAHRQLLNRLLLTRQLLTRQGSP